MFTIRLFAHFEGTSAAEDYFTYYFTYYLHFAFVAKCSRVISRKWQKPSLSKQLQKDISCQLRSKDDHFYTKTDCDLPFDKHFLLHNKCPAPTLPKQVVTVMVWNTTPDGDICFTHLFVCFADLKVIQSGFCNSAIAPHSPVL